MKRSDVIALAQGDILQGTVDPLWSATNWDTFFNDAVDILHEALVDADLDVFKTRGATLTLATDGSGNPAYALPENLHQIDHVSDGDPVYPVTREEEKVKELAGYVLADEYLYLVNWDGDMPATLTLDYTRLPKVIPTYAGVADPDGDITLVPDFPLNSNRGARAIAKIMVIMAQVKDESNMTAQMDLAKAAADRFVDRILARSQGN